MAIDLKQAVDELERNMSLGRIPVIVIGSGMSAGVGAPTMGGIHHYLKERLSRCNQTSTVSTITTLLEVLNHEAQSPRSVQVRVYHLLQSSLEPEIRNLWHEFGNDLIAGNIRPKDGRSDWKATPMWQLPPSAAHQWAARLAIQRRAIAVSLNYDGLTKRAIEAEAQNLMVRPPEGVRTSRILSTADEIRHYFTGTEKRHDQAHKHKAQQAASGEEARDKLAWSPVPVIKFRGDVFHAICDNGRCPEAGRSSPLYHILGLKTAMPDMGLTCSSCGWPTELRISFPGVFGKEREIDEALAAFHELFGTGLAGVVFLGFSGTWDEVLVEYFVERAKHLSVPIISLSHARTPAIEDWANRKRAEYAYSFYLSQKAASDPFLEEILETQLAAIAERTFCQPSRSRVEFPEQALVALLGSRFNSFKLTLPSNGVTREIEVEAKVGADSFTGVAGEALKTVVIERLQRCSQLGLKGTFVSEEDPTHHSRFHHSAGATMVGMLWYEAMLTFRNGADTWAWTEEARLALELAVLFHDARHLPFSHMMEEVFQELNWGQAPALTWPEIHRYTKDVQPDFVKFGGVLKNALDGIGVSTDDPKDWWEKVKALQDGLSGVPWLEAIVDSALDADKMEYVFHDTRLTGQNVRLTKWQPWFQAFLSGQSLTPEGLIRLEHQSCTDALELLQERLHLYRRLYLAPELRALECLARYIVLTWIKWKVPDVIQIPSDKVYDLDESLRALKSETAGKLLWQKFAPEKDPPKNELAGLNEMVADLRDKLPHLDDAAREWLNGLWSHLEKFVAAQSQPTMHQARNEYTQMAPIGPLYVHWKYEKKIREIVRIWRVHYPLVALVDVVRFPRFLATPRNRRAEIGARKPVAEQFLVPSPKPSEWHRKSRATTPLCHCDFGSFEYPVLQIIIFDPWGESSGGSSFLHQMLLREFQRLNIEHAESPEGVSREKEEL